MSAEARRVTKTQVWVGWENQVVNSAYPLRRFLGGSNHSAVFLTEYRPEGIANAAIKLVPADTLETEAQLVQWGAAATLNHPHLLRIFDVGRCHIGGRVFLYVVMEYADQTLAQLLPRRALTPDETREMLIPALSALHYLHRNNLVQGQVKPTNLLVVGDQLKLASDTIRSTGKLATGILRASLHDPPELKDGEISPAGDIWGVGVTLVEALTQHPPSWPDAKSETVSLTANIPPLFIDTVRRCLNRTPANRPTAAELQGQFDPAVHAHPITVVAAEEPVYDVATVSTASAAEVPAAAPRSAAGSGIVVLGVAAVLVLGLAVWVSRTIFAERIEGGPSGADHAAAAAAGASDDAGAGTGASAGVTAGASSGAAVAASAGASGGAAARTTGSAGASDGAAAGAAASAGALSGAATSTAAAGGAAAGTAASAGALGGAGGDTAAGGTAPGGADGAGDAPAGAAAAAAHGASAVGAPGDVGTPAESPTRSTFEASSASAARAPALSAAGGAQTSTAEAPSARGESGGGAAIGRAAYGGIVAHALSTGRAAAGTVPTGASRSVQSPTSPPSTPSASGGAAQFADSQPEILGSVLHQKLPDIPRNIREKIRGHVNVTVRVLVDPTGNVVGEFLESAGPSRYFAHQAGDAAIDWKFVSSDGRGPRVWMLKFEFTRTGTTVRAVGTQ